MNFTPAASRARRTFALLLARDVLEAGDGFCRICGSLRPAVGDGDLRLTDDHQARRATLAFYPPTRSARCEFQDGRVTSHQLWVGGRQSSLSWAAGYQAQARP
jgi:hypothetical protein